jgi:hypothetical protein
MEKLFLHYYRPLMLMLGVMKFLQLNLSRKSINHSRHCGEYHHPIAKIVAADIVDVTARGDVVKYERKKEGHRRGNKSVGKNYRKHAAQSAQSGSLCKHAVNLRIYWENVANERGKNKSQPYPHVIFFVNFVLHIISLNDKQLQYCLVDCAHVAAFAGKHVKLQRVQIVHTSFQAHLRIV